MKKLNPNSQRAEENGRRKSPRRNGQMLRIKLGAGLLSKMRFRRNASRKSPITDKQAKNKANEQERVQKKQKNIQIVDKMKPNTISAKEA